MNRKTLFINLFAAPGVGKTTASSGLFFLMKIQNEKVRLLQEFPKDLIDREDKRTLSFQPYILARHYYSQHIVDGKYDYVIVDSPLILSSIFKTPGCTEHFDDIVLEQFNQFNNINFFLTRMHDSLYDDTERRETYEESLAKDLELKELLNTKNIPFINIDITPDFSYVEKMIGILKKAV